MRKSRLALSQIMLSILTLLLFTNNAWAGDIPFIKTADLKAKMDGGAQLVLANALSPIEHNELSIKGSVNIPASMVKGNPNLPADKGTLLIFYCKGPKCGKSRIAAQKANGMGYTMSWFTTKGFQPGQKKSSPWKEQSNTPKSSWNALSPSRLMP